MNIIFSACILKMKNIEYELQLLFFSECILFQTIKNIRIISGYYCAISQSSTARGFCFFV